MDILTHVLSGALLARATATRTLVARGLSLQARVAAGCVAAAFPDADIVLRPLDTLAYLNWHQGSTHSLLLLPLWALGLAALFSLATRRRYGWREFYSMAALGIVIHIAGDVITAYGTMLFAPFSERRYSLSLAFVVDPYLTAIIVAALLAAALFPGRRWIAGAGLAGLAAYVGWQGMLHGQAVAVGAGHAQQQGVHAAQTRALPQPLSPLHWQIIVSHGDHYQIAYVSLLRERGLVHAPWPGVLADIAAAYRPAAAAQWQVRHRVGTTPAEITLAQEAWHHPAFAGFRKFALYPALDHVAVTGDGAACVWFVDLRFALPAVAPSFRFGMCRPSADGEWQLQRLRGDFLLD